MDFHLHFSDDSAQNALNKQTSDSYTFQFSHKIGRYGIKVGELMCDNLKQWYTTYEKK